MKKDYFAILGLKPSATDKEIRSAYKKLAKKYHPDVNPNNKQAEEKFKEISEAHDVLTDPEKRRKWELGESDFEDFLRQARKGRRRDAGADQGFSGFRFEDAGDLGSILGDLFGGMGEAGARRRTSRGADLQYETTLTFDQAIHGTTLRIPLARMGVCPECQGSGKMPGKSGPCRNCGGEGVLPVNETIQVRI